VVEQPDVGSIENFTPAKAYTVQACSRIAGGGQALLMIWVE